MKRICIALLLSLVTLPALAALGPVEQIRQTTDKLYNAIQEHRAEYEAHPSRLEDLVRDLLLPHLDSDYTGRLVLGRHARGLTTEQVNAFTTALSNMLLDRYAGQLLEFDSREQLKILPLEGPASDARTRVQTVVHLDTGQAVPVDYVMHKTENGWQVFDVVVEGISYVITFRSQFDQELSQNSFGDVLNRIQKGEVEVVSGAGE